MDEAFAPPPEEAGEVKPGGPKVERSEPDGGGASPAAEAPPTKPAAAAVEPEADSRPIGDGDRGWASVAVSEDRLLASLTALALNGLELSARELAEELARAYGLQGTFDGRTLRRALAEARAQGVARGRFDILHGVEPQPGEDGRVEIVCLPDRVEDKRGALAADIPAALKGKCLEEVLQHDLAGVLVAPGEAIARLRPPSPGTPGKDVFGAALEGPGAAARVEAGEGVRIEGEEVIAEVFGWVRLAGDTFQVVPSIWVSPDATEGHFVHFRELLRRREVKPEWLTDSLRHVGVTAGVDEEALAALCANWPPATTVTAIAAAAAVAPVDGVDAHVEYTVDPAKRAGRVREDGSIDYRERNAATGIAEGDLIGRVVEATPGTSGADLHGTGLPARDGDTRSFSAGANVETRTEDGALAFYSQIDGALVVSSDSIEVQPIFSVNGDVDYETGNIDLPMNVEISGSVRPGFSVVSRANVTIGGILEPGARVQAVGDVVVANGIFGEQTRVAAGGDLETKLIQNGTVVAGGNIVVGAYIYNGIVRAGGDVVVAEGSGDRSGSIVGGETIAGQRIQAQRIGSAKTDRTVVGIDETPEEHEERRRLEQEIRTSNHEISRLIGELRLAGATPEEIAARRARCRDEQELARVEALIAQLQASLQTKTQAQEQIEVSDKRLRERVLAGTVRAQTFFADVYVRFGSDVSRVGERIASAEFRRGEEGIRWRPV